MKLPWQKDESKFEQQAYYDRLFEGYEIKDDYWRFLMAEISWVVFIIVPFIVVLFGMLAVFGLAVTVIIAGCVLGGIIGWSINLWVLTKAKDRVQNMRIIEKVRLPTGEVKYLEHELSEGLKPIPLLPLTDAEVTEVEKLLEIYEKTGEPQDFGSVFYKHMGEGVLERLRKVEESGGERKGFWRRFFGRIWRKIRGRRKGEG